MTDDRPYIEISFTGQTLTQYTSNTLNGTNIVIDYGDGTTVNYTGDYSHTYSTSGTYTIRIYGVTSLGANCFRSCTGLTSVVISESVTSLGSYCFYNCTGLTSVVISESVTSFGNSCFYNCTDLTSVVISESVTSLGDSCFKRCTGLTSVVIPNSITSLEYRCFEGCTGLTSVIIPSSVTNLGISCFVQCTGLTNVVIPNSVTSLSDYCFALCTGLVDIQLNWTSSTDIITYNSSWIEDTNDDVVFIIPQGTTSLYSVKGYPSEKLVERSSNVSSHELFSDVTSLLLNGNEVESIVVDDTDGLILYQKPHTSILLTATNNTISYGETVTLNGTVDGVNSGTVKLYQNDTLIDTLNISNNGSFTKTFNNLNAGTYTYKAVYDGDNTHYDGQSSEVIITVNKLTPVLTLNSDKSVIHYNETVTLSGTTTVDGTIKIRQGGVLSPLTSIESVNGTFSYTFTNKRQDTIQVFAVIDATDNYNFASSDIVILTYSKYSTNLTIEVPALVYSDTFDVTGLLTDDNNNPISGASVKLYRDSNILEATETTDNNGEVTFHRNAPTSITSYDFQLKYDGDTYHNSSDSSVVTRVVNKETSILNIESPLNESTYMINGNKIQVSGNLSDNDGTPLENKNVQIKKNNDSITTLTTNEEGDFFGLIRLIFLDIGENELDFVFDEEEFYTGSTQTITVNMQDELTSTPSSLTLNSNRNTLSYLHNESATLTATVLDENNNPCADELVVFNVDGTITNALTNNNGVATTTYNSNNDGEIYVTATCSNLQDSITINDIYYYNSGAELSKVSDFNVNGRWSAKNTSAGNVTCTTDETEWLNITASGISNYGHIPITPLIGLNQPFKLSCIIKDANRDDRGSGGTYVSSYSGFYACRSTGGYGILLQWSPFRIPRSDKGSYDNWATLSYAQNPSNGTYKYEVTFNGSSITHKLYYLDGNVYKTASISCGDLNNANYSVEYGISYDNQRNFDIKDIKAELL